MKNDEEDHVFGLIEDPNTLNYAISCVAFEFKEIAKCLLVNYQAKPGAEVQERLPAGRFQAQDLIFAVEDILEQNGRNQSLEFFCLTVDGLNRKYLSVTEDVSDFGDLNYFFNNFTEKLLIELQRCNLSEVEYREILKKTHLNTVLRELKEETNAQNIGNLYLSSVSSKEGVHYKLGYVSIDVDASDPYVGSADKKILKAYWSPVDEQLQKRLFKGHTNNFQEGVREAIKLNLHPKIKSLEKFLTASR